MDRRDFTKVFDVSRPSSTGPDPTSKPVIVGHHPMMADPMVRQTSAHADPEAGFSPSPHHAKVIEVSQETRSHIIQTQPPSPQELASAAAAEESKPTVMSAPLPAVAAPAHEAAPQTLASPVPATAAQPEPMSQPQPVLPIQQSSPEPVTPPATPDLSHIQHVPVSHMPASPGGRLKMAGIWLFIAVFLAAFALYLAIDAGFIQTGINLPFHIFSRQG